MEESFVHIFSQEIFTDLFKEKKSLQIHVNFSV